MSMTIKELMSKIKSNRISVAYANSRTVLRHMNEPLLAYAYGYAGFLAVFKKRGGIEGVCYVCDQQFKSRDVRYGGFKVVECDWILDEIRNNELFVNRFVDEEALLNVKTTPQPEMIGNITAEETWNGTNFRSYEVRIMKSHTGNIFCKHTIYWKSTFKRIGYSEMLRIYEALILSKAKVKTYDGYTYKNIVNTIQPETIKLIRDIDTARKI